MARRPSGFFQRVIRANRERMEAQIRDEIVREQEVGTCFECKMVYPWSKLVDESTQQYPYVICINCIALRDPRVRGQQGG